MVRAMSDDKALDAEAARTIARVRRLMVVVVAATFLAVVAVLVVIGYRVFRLGESAVAPPDKFADVTAALPVGAKVISTDLDNEHIMVTVEVNGETQILTFDPDTLKPLGRLRLQPKP
jgi:hypothetical protein